MVIFFEDLQKELDITSPNLLTGKIEVTVDGDVYFLPGFQKTIDLSNVDIEQINEDFFC